MSFRETVRGASAVGTRECAAAFGSPIAWICAAVFALVANALYMNEFFLRGVIDFTPWFERLPLLLAVTIPAITMRSFAEERKQRTLEFLLTLPLLPRQVWIGKCIAALAQAALLLSSGAPVVALLLFLGSPDLGRIAAGFVGAVQLSFLLVCIGLCGSAITRDQVVAYVVATTVGVGLLLCGEPRLVAVLDGWWPAGGLGTFFAEHLSALPRFQRSVDGVLEASSVLYFFGYGVWFLVAGAAALDRRRS